ncbi:MAG: sulfurtransferase complex subunit TusB [Alphaproteobacteria bacterium]|nr:sulfurtransferase complex subunit TusB [Alphaproteobacteria bacterium]MDE2012924.1 sulfurtransferase complex subunit TusB [Alphaproteobacteria bacterium]MDE2074064.1 sulfurtransferase complex subunit TusB [Alphaproteobacteria bacterium]MDE2350726.1 sulfurtransferase complex subunit TusB [Alphaproteobacteria bacterium]
MAVLHTTNKSPLQTRDLESCLRLSRSGCGILLMEDAVYGALKGTAESAKLAEAAKARKIYVLGPDLAARGFTPEHLVQGVKVVDYSGFVDLAVEYHHVQAWV